MYTPELVREMESAVDEVLPRLTAPSWFMQGVENTLRTEQGKEYAANGVCRRLITLGRCVENIFAVFPPNRTVLLELSEQHDVEINIQAFLINVYGVLDNIAWVYVSERNLSLKPQEVGLFRRATQKHLPVALLGVLNESKRWYEDYAKNYRDALAHRIPLYLSPFGVLEDDLDEHRRLGQLSLSLLKEGRISEMERIQERQKRLRTVSFCITHSIVASRSVLLHPQIIVDSRTVLKITDAFLDDLRQTR